MKQRAGKTWFFLATGILNLAVGGMFYTVMQRPPVAAAAPLSSASSQKVAAQPQVVAATKGIPVRIVIPSLAMDLPVGVGSYDPASGNWTLDTTKAYYADVSLPVNDSNGRTLIYGHAQAPVFEALVSLPPEAKAEVYTDNGYVFRYSYTAVKEVTPDDVSIFGADGPPTLVLQTCTGAWSAYRALYSFTFESVQKI